LYKREGMDLVQCFPQDYSKYEDKGGGGDCHIGTGRERCKNEKIQRMM